MSFAMKSPAESSSRTEFSVLLAADSFKGSASSEAIEKYLEAGVLRALPHAQIKKEVLEKELREREKLKTQQLNLDIDSLFDEFFENYA